MKRTRNTWDRLRRQRQCGRKRQFETRAQARRAAAKLRALDGAAMTEYECPWCGWWHVGHDTSGKG